MCDCCGKPVDKPTAGQVGEETVLPHSHDHDHESGHSHDSTPGQGCAQQPQAVFTVIEPQSKDA